MNKNLIYNLLKQRGLKVSAIAGIMANIYFESGYSTTIIGDGGTSYGLCQWHNDRMTRLKSKANYHTAETQIAYLFEELNSGYKVVMNEILNAQENENSAYNVGYVFCKRFEIPADTENQAIKRGNYARSLYHEFMNSTNEAKKSNEEVANEVIRGIYGNGDERKRRLTSLGYDYATIQSIVNSKLSGNKKSNEEVANEVIRGIYGNGDERKQKLASLGYDYATIQSIVNKKLRGY